MSDTISFSPYLMFNGCCEEAMQCYARNLDGEITYMGTYGESPMADQASNKDKIMHASLQFEGGTIMGSDHMDAASYTTDGSSSNIHLSLTFHDLSKMTTVFNGLKEDGEVTMEIEEQFWGDQFGMLTDKFGIHWMLSCRKEGQDEG